MLDFFKNIEEQEIKLKKGRAVILIRDAAFRGEKCKYNCAEIEVHIKSLF